MTRLRALVALPIVSVALIASAPLAHALPPGGASPNTPGTTSSISPSTVEQCGTINFSVTGYPAGEVVYVKIDDGAGYDQSVQGTGVVAQSRIDSSGSASGAVDLDCSIAVGSHWLRFLASQPVEGGGGGVKGYSNRSDDFTVTAASGGNDTNSVTSVSDDEASTTTSTVNVTTESTSTNASAVQAKAQTNNAQSNQAGVVVSNSGDSGDSSSSGSGNTTNDAALGGETLSTKGLFNKNANSQSATTTTANTAASTNLAAAPAQGYDTISDKPWIGAFVGLAIMFVGLAAINTWLWAQRNPVQRKSAHGDETSPTNTQERT